MKHLVFIVSVVLLAVFSSCSSQDKTIANLKAAIDGEATAAEKYAAWAEKAGEEHNYSVQALFRAAVRAETIHLNNHQKVLAALGVKNYEPNEGTYSVLTTAQNLKEAINGETYEAAQMYPKFIKDAQDEGVKDAVKSFDFAQKAEQSHAFLYKRALGNITTPSNIPLIYFVCPECGFMYADKVPVKCEVCGVPGSKFIKVEGNLPVDVVTSASTRAV